MQASSAPSTIIWSSFRTIFPLAGVVLEDDAKTYERRYCHLAMEGGTSTKTRLPITWARAGDALLALALAAYSQLEIWAPDAAVGIGDVVGSKAALAPTVLLATLPLMLRRRFPLGVLCVVMAALLAQDLLTTPAEGLSILVATLVGVYSVAAYSDLTRAVIGLTVALAATLVYGAQDAADFAFSVVVMVAPWLAGRAIRGGRRRAAELEDLTVQLEHEREENARLAVAEERSRIARELHDVVAHSVSVMVVQAGAVRRLLAPEQEREREALVSVESTGRQALDEMRRLLGILRTDTEGLALAPQPGLAQVETLVEQIRDAGLDVELRVEGERVDLSPGVDLSAYRIVQEALTNSLKHAGPAHAQIVVRYRDRELELEVTDDGRGPSNGTGGHGLVGMRERVALFGGELEAGRRDSGGFALRARLPIDQSRR